MDSAYSYKPRVCCVKAIHYRCYDEEHTGHATEENWVIFSLSKCASSISVGMETGNLCSN